MAITFEPIATTTLTATATTISFTSLSASFTWFKVIVSAAQSGTSNTAYVRYNNNSTGVDYSNWVVVADSSTTKSAKNTNDSEGIQLGNGYGSSTNPFCGVIDVVAATQTTTWKVPIHVYGDGGTGADIGVQLTTGTYESTSALNQIDVRMNTTSVWFTVGTKVSIYGITKA